MNQQAANQNDEEDGEEEEDEIAEEILFESPLDEVDPYLCFEQVFRGKKQQYSGFHLSSTHIVVLL